MFHLYSVDSTHIEVGSILLIAHSSNRITKGIDLVSESGLRVFIFDIIDIRINFNADKVLC